MKEKSMAQRLNYFQIVPEAIEILMNQEAYLTKQFEQSTIISKQLWHLIKLRVSQLNQCAYCIEMHRLELTKLKETPQRLMGLNAWRDMPFFTSTERAALSWAESITLNHVVRESDYQAVLQTLGEKNLVDLTIAVNAINGWNRVAKAFKPEVGNYQFN